MALLTAKLKGSAMGLFKGVNDADYQVPFTFNGKIVKITLDINRPQLSPDDIKKLEEWQRKASDN